MPHATYDSITVDELRELGSVKWTMFPDTIGAFVAEMDFGLAPPVSQALRTTLDRGLTGYLPPELATRMSAATSAWCLDTYGWDVPAAWVHPVPDVIAALEITITKFSPPGSKIIVPTPAYMPFLTVPTSHNREVIEVPSVEINGRWLMDLDGIAQAFDDGGHLLILCNPHNPLGTVASRDELIAISRVVEDKGGRVFSDEIHAPLVFRGHSHVPYASVSTEAAGHTITATSASKAWNLAGLKCAQVIISNEADEAHWQTFGFMASHGASNMGVVGNTAAYTSGRKWLQDVIDYLDGNRQLLGELVEEHLPDVRYSAPDGTYIAWLDFRDCAIEGDLAEFFRTEAGVSISDGVVCGAVGAGFARFVFALPRPVMREAIERMGAALRRRDIALPEAS